MKINSGAVNIEPQNPTNHYSIIETISEGRVFRLFKARYGTKYVILKTTHIQDAMHSEILRREYEMGKTLSHACSFRFSFPRSPYPTKPTCRRVRPHLSRNHTVEQGVIRYSAKPN